MNKSELEKANELLLEANTSLQARHDTRGAEIKTLRTNLEAVTSKLSRTETRHAILVKDYDKLAEVNRNIVQECKELKANFDTAELNIQTLMDSKIQLQSEIQGIQLKVKDYLEERKSLVAERDYAKKRMKKLREELNTSNDALDEVVVERDNLKQVALTHDRGYILLEEKCDELQARIGELARERDHYMENNKTLVARAANSDTHIRELERNLDALQSAQYHLRSNVQESRNALLNAPFRASPTTNNIDNFISTLPTVARGGAMSAYNTGIAQARLMLETILKKDEVEPTQD
jgi:chromosome segregation ATPase